MDEPSLRKYPKTTMMHQRLVAKLGALRFKSDHKNRIKENLLTILSMGIFAMIIDEFVF